jgi:Flp pilus assembly protein TadG
MFSGHTYFEAAKGALMTTDLRNKRYRRLSSHIAEKRGMVRFGADKSGSVTILFALTILVACGSVALGLDYARALAVRTMLQNAVDAAALAARADKDVSTAAMQARVNASFGYNTQQKFGAVTVVATSTPITNGIRVDATADVPTTFGRLLGVDKIPIRVTAEATNGDSLVEVALVLDNTGSMSGTKLATLKTAAAKLVDKIFTESPPGRLKVGLVPFSNYVNVGMKYRGAAWLSVPNDSSQTTNQCYFDQKYKNCQTVSGTCYNDGVASSCTQTTGCEPDGPPVKVCGNVTVTNVWNGCVGSRKPTDYNRVASGGSPVPGIQNVLCPSPLVRLDTSPSAIKSEINAMVATGETYVSSGIMWGWRILSPDAPFADAAAMTRAARKVMIVMTDGENTRSQLDVTHDGWDSTLANTNLSTLCSAVKQDGVEVFTIAFTVTSTTIKDLLSTCSSGPGYSYAADKVSDLDTAFNGIAATLVRLALTK